MKSKKFYNSLIWDLVFPSNSIGVRKFIRHFLVYDMTQSSGYLNISIIKSSSTVLQMLKSHIINSSKRIMLYFRINQ